MDKDQPDSLATVAVGGKEIPPPHSHYAPSEVYSTTEPPPAYMRPGTKSSAVQIARIAAVTLIAMSVVLGCFILASSYVQARASCTPEAIAALQAEMKLQQHQQDASQSQGEYIKHIQPEALVQDHVDPTDSLQVLTNSVETEKEVQPDTKDMKVQKDESSKTAESNDSNDTEEEDDYDDDEFPPVHIKLPLQLDLDDIAGTLMQQVRSRVSCVVERKRAGELTDGSNDNSIDNSTDPQRFQKLLGERIAIFCESGNPQQEAQDQDMMTPIIVPLGTVQIPIHPQDSNAFNQFQIHSQYQVPDMQQLPLSNPRGLNHIPPGLLPPAFRGLPQLTVDMRPPRMEPLRPLMGPQRPMMGPQPPMMGPQVEMRQIPIELRHFPMDPMRGMRPPMPPQPHEEQQPPMMPSQPRPIPVIHPEHMQMSRMVPPQPESSNNHFAEQEQQRPMMTPMMPPQESRSPMMPPANSDSERSSSPFQGIPIEIRRIIQQVPLEIKNIIQHITSDSRPFPVPEGQRREVVQEFKPFPDGARPIPLGPFPLPIEVRNLLEHGNIEGRQEQQTDSSEEQQQDAKPFPGPEDQGEEAERNFPVPVEVRNLIHQVVEGRAFPVPRFPLPLKPVESLEIPVEARTEVSDDQATEPMRDEEQRGRQESLDLQAHQSQQEQDMENRPHYVQPRSVRSIPEPFAHRREKRVRRCACNCAC
ncbi:bromodomain-containing protein 4 [Neodiprion lecontei]|uniref:Bromodomain-containing protein 4 n=1 Tax=Neodiprion lecontei TaxID=441921 RepID=A0A6J0C8V6_NEOLC|nr:bromodomain-containing protein 4 [Neodiprion lecontei]